MSGARPGIEISFSGKRTIGKTHRHRHTRLTVMHAKKPQQTPHTSLEEEIILPGGCRGAVCVLETSVML